MRQSKFKTALECFYSHLVKLDNGCHILDIRPFSSGYSGFSFLGKTYRAHKFIYEQLIGPTNGLDPHHQCEYKRCVNPGHLELKTRKEHNALHYTENNIMRKKAEQTHCINGHEYTKENTSYHNNDHRRCKICHRKEKTTSYSTTQNIVVKQKISKQKA